MLDVVSDEAIRNSIYIGIVDLVVELIVVFAVDRLVFKAWKVSLFDLAQAFIRSIGKLGIFSTPADSILIRELIVFYFMNYHYG